MKHLLWILALLFSMSLSAQPPDIITKIYFEVTVDQNASPDLAGLKIGFAELADSVAVFNNGDNYISSYFQHDLPIRPGETQKDSLTFINLQFPYAQLAGNPYDLAGNIGKTSASYIFSIEDKEPPIANAVFEVTVKVRVTIK